MPEPDIRNKHYFSTGELAQILNVHRNTVIQTIRQGKLKFKRTPGGHSRIPRSEVLRFLRDCGMSTAELVPDGFQKPRVLIVDDDPDIVRLVSETLAAKNIAISTASNGFEAGMKTMQERPDLILLDIMLPAIDGFKVLELTRGAESVKDTKIIAATGASETRIVRKIERSGFDGYLPKPFTRDQLLAMVSKHIPLGSETV